MKKDPKKPSKPLKLKKEAVRDVAKKTEGKVRGGMRAGSPACNTATYAPPYIPFCT